MDFPGEGSERFAPILSLSRSVLGGAAAVLYRIEDDNTERELARSSLPPAFSAAYHAGLRDSDPLSAARLCPDRRKVALFSREREALGPGADSPYASAMESYGFSDALEMILWAGGVPVIGIGLLSAPGREGFGDRQLDLARSMQAHFETMILHTPQFRRDVAERLFLRRYGLSEREMEIVRLIAEGATNADICDILDIRLPTVKTHVARAFDKMGVDTRTAMVSRYLRAETWLS
ncbi:helix-turn-helix transcriptional regulator [Poseidonocella sp. HB161398]|uniref:helix-turn-helix transcriptional regulator n=1 Tax=Poseidonocella sp. HB161398 TaxID=2320855 RepID=UPI001107FE1C|nr:helix-turn-helix transcriptional regulator [Poseidonocella sp. HB161398]